MPELPEVETTRRGIIPKLKGQRIEQVIINHHKLRWPIPKELTKKLTKQAVQDITRRGKYLLIQFTHGTLLIHLGMSGHLKFVAANTPYLKHDHVALLLSNGLSLRYNDPRRFGAWLWTDEPIEQHPLLEKLGPEPLTDDFNIDYLSQRIKNKKAPIKQVIMDSHVVVGVGNIYANEALFRSKIHPKRAANQISQQRLAELVKMIKVVLAEAIQQGGTSLKDFIQSDGKPGYFKQQLQVYGRTNEACVVCQTPLKEIKLGQRTSVYCPNCQR